ncbi:MAG: GumC family protein [Steroidobacteraceae bacterium]
MTETPEISSGPGLADYFSALKRRRMLLASVALPILAISAALALGLPSLYVSTGLFTFTYATVPGEMPASPNEDLFIQQQEQYRDAYVDSLSRSVMTAHTFDELARAIPGVVPPGTDSAAAEKHIARHTTVVPVRTPVLDPQTGRNRDIITAFSVSYDSRNPQLAARAATWLTNAFLLGSRQEPLLRAKAAEQFYDTQTLAVRQRIASINTKLATFKAKNYDQLPGLTDIDMNIMDTTQRDMDNVTQQLEAARQSHVFLQQQLDAAKNAGEDTGLLEQLQAEYNQKLATYDPNYPDMIALRQQIDVLKEGGGAIDSLSLPAQLRAEEQLLAQTRLRYTSNFPDVQRIERQIKILKTRIAHGEKYAGNAQGSPAVVELETQLDANRTQTQGLERQQAQLQSQLGKLSQNMQASPEVEREYDALTMNLQQAQTQYNTLLQNQMNAQVTSQAIASGRSDKIRIVQHPGTPLEPGKPERIAIGVVGLMLAILLGLTVVVIAESFDQSVRGSRDVRSVLALAPLAVIPEIADPATARRLRWQVAMLTMSVCVVTLGVLVTARIFYS